MQGAIGRTRSRQSGSGIGGKMLEVGMTFLEELTTRDVTLGCSEQGGALRWAHETNSLQNGIQPAESSDHSPRPSREIPSSATGGQQGYHDVHTQTCVEVTTHILRGELAD
eukprot:391307-Prymnesium_polylepis.1